METVIDPIRMPTVTLSQKEMDDIEELMATGALSPDFLERYHAAVANNVFGADHKRDKFGDPIEQGIGSAGNQTRNSINAYKKFAKYDPDYTPEKFAATVKKMEADLAASNDTRKAAAAAAAGRNRRAGVSAGRR